MSPEHFDRPIVFLLVISVGVAATWAVISWGLIKMGWTGPLGLFKQGVMGGTPTSQ